MGTKGCFTSIEHVILMYHQNIKGSSRSFFFAGGKVQTPPAAGFPIIVNGKVYKSVLQTHESLPVVLRATYLEN